MHSAPLALGALLPDLRIKILYLANNLKCIIYVLTL